MQVYSGLNACGKDISLPGSGWYGLLSGYGVFTTLRYPTSEGLFKRHLQRLQNHANTLELAFPWRQTDLSIWLQTLCQNTPQQVLRLSVYPETDTLSELTIPSTNLLPTRLIAAFRPLASTSNPPYRLMSIPYQRPLPAIKHTHLLESIVHCQHAKQQGYDDALWVNLHGHVSETTTANLFALHQNTFYTPNPEQDGCLPGITAAILTEFLTAQGVSVCKQSITLEALKAMDAVFLTNSVSGIRAVTAIDTTSFSKTVDHPLYQLCMQAPLLN